MLHQNWVDTTTRGNYSTRVVLPFIETLTNKAVETPAGPHEKPLLFRTMFCSLPVKGQYALASKKFLSHRFTYVYCQHTLA